MCLQSPPINPADGEPFSFALIDVIDQEGNAYAPEQIYALIEQYEGYGVNGTINAGGEDVITENFATCGFSGEVFEIETTEDVNINATRINLEATGTETGFLEILGDSNGIKLEHDSYITISVDNGVSGIEINSSTSSSMYSSGNGQIVIDNTGIRLQPNVLSILNVFIDYLPTYANNTNPLSVGAVYKTATGELRIKI